MRGQRRDDDERAVLPIRPFRVSSYRGHLQQVIINATKLTVIPTSVLMDEIVLLLLLLLLWLLRRRRRPPGLAGVSALVPAGRGDDDGGGIVRDDGRSRAIGDMRWLRDGGGWGRRGGEAVLQLQLLLLPLLLMMAELLLLRLLMLPSLVRLILGHLADIDDGTAIRRPLPWMISPTIAIVDVRVPRRRR